MTPRTTRLVRGSVLGLGLAVAGTVAWNLRRPAPPPAPALPTPSRSPAEAGSRTTDLVYRSFKEGRESFVLQARSMVGKDQEELRLTTVTMDFTYVAEGQPAAGRITADECLYTPSLQKAVFEGHVRVRGGDGFELDTESLIYRGDKGLAKSDVAAEFRRKDLSGSSRGFIYHAEEGLLELLEDVHMTIAGEGAAPTQIESARAVVEREKATMEFDGEVQATQGADALKASHLTLNFARQDRVLERAFATGDVELRTVGARSLPGASPRTAAGPRVLRSQVLALSFREDRSIEGATASPDAELVVMPGRTGPRERRTVRSKVLNFLFDKQGRLEEVQGQRESSFVSEPVPPARGVPRNVTSRGFVARFDAATGETREVDFGRDVEFTQGPQKATAEKGAYDAGRSLLVLKGNPELTDTARGSHLAAQVIEIGTESGDLAARHGVKHVMRTEASPGRPGFLAAQDSMLTCRFFDYDARVKTSRYREGALLRSGKDEIRAPEIKIQEEREGKRRLLATGGVVSILNPAQKGDAEGKPPPAPVEGRARELLYEESGNRVVYTGDVMIRQGDIMTKSPEATLTLAPDGGTLQTLVAGEPVEVQQGARVATGSRGTYTPSNQTLVLVGDTVIVKDPTQVAQGRSLTFRVGEDTILIGGREGRTETVFKKEAPKP